MGYGQRTIHGKEDHLEDQPRSEMRIDLRRIANHEQLCYQYETELTEEHSGSDWETLSDGRHRRMSPLTTAIINAAIDLGMPYISHMNVTEFIFRIELAFDSDWPFLYTDSHEGPLPVTIDRDLIRQHVGLTVEARSLSTQQFYTLIRERRMRTLAQSLE